MDALVGLVFSLNFELFFWDLGAPKFCCCCGLKTFLLLSISSLKDNFKVPFFDIPLSELKLLSSLFSLFTIFLFI